MREIHITEFLLCDVNSSLIKAEPCLQKWNQNELMLVSDCKGSFGKCRHFVLLFLPVSDA